MSEESDDPQSDRSRGGRPRIDPALRRRSRVLLRLKAREKARIQKAATRSGLTLSAYVRRKVLVDGPKPRVSRETRDRLRELEVRTNAFARQANIEGRMPSEAQLDRLLGELRQMLHRLRRDLGNHTTDPKNGAI